MVKSKLSPSSGSVAMRQLNPIQIRGQYFFSLIFTELASSSCINLHVTRFTKASPSSSDPS